MFAPMRPSPTIANSIVSLLAVEFVRRACTASCALLQAVRRRPQQGGLRQQDHVDGNAGEQRGQPPFPPEGVDERPPVEGGDDTAGDTPPPVQAPRGEHLYSESFRPPAPDPGTKNQQPPAQPTQ